MDLNLKCYDWASNFYDCTRSIPDTLIKQVAEVFSKQLGFTRGARILEIGIGTGRIAIPLAAELKNLDPLFYGIDISKRMLKKCRENINLESNLQLVNAEGTKLPFSTDFQIIFTSHILHLIKNPFRFVDQIIQYLASNGKYINIEAYVNYQETIPFSIFYQKLSEAGYHHVFRGDLVRREISIYLINKGWKYKKINFKSTKRVQINTLVRFLKNRVFSHQREIPNDLYLHSLDSLYKELEERNIDLSSDIIAPAVSILSIFSHKRFF